MATIQGIFVALFNRPADPAGLAFYTDPANAGTADAIKDLSGVPEYLQRFAGITNDFSAIVTTIFSDLLGRNPDSDGLKFYVDRLNSKEFTVNDVAIRILDGASGGDKSIVDNKLTAAGAFTAALDQPDEIAAYNGGLNKNAIPFGAQFLAGITGDPATVPTAAQVDASVKNLVDQAQNPQTPGDNFSLKDDPGEILAGTSGNDTFSGVLDAVPANSTFDAGDMLDGKGGDSDVFNLTITTLAPLPPGSAVKNIEIINLISGGGVVTAPIDASYFQGAKEVWQVGAFSQIQNVGAGVTAGFRDGVFAPTVEFDQKSGLIALDKVTSGATFFLDGPSATTLLDEITVSGTVKEAGVGVPGIVMLNDNAFSAVTQVNLNFTSSVELQGGIVNTLKHLDASGSDKGVTVDLSANLNVISSVFGDGADDVTLFINPETQTANLSGGADIAKINAFGVAADKTLVVDVGAGDSAADIVQFTAPGNVVSATVGDFLKQLITITGFNASQDLINGAGLGGTGLEAQNAVNAAAALGADLFAAVTNVSAVNSNGNTSAQFTFGGDLYLYVDAGVANVFDAGDTLIKVAGQGLLPGAALSGL